MCGIAGILYSNSNKFILKDRIQKMQNAQFHRGPDSQKIIFFKNSALGHTRLSLIDYEGGLQPFSDISNRYTLVFNGEIYNYEELKKTLNKSYVFLSNSDTEVLLALYLKFGKDCIYHLEGMYSFFIWDNLKEEGFAARDHLGVKPFVYSNINGEFIFASESKAILAAWNKKPEINKLALAEYITTPSLSGVRYSMFKDIHYLGAGERMSICKNNIQIDNYYQFNIASKTDNINELKKELIEKWKLNIKKSIKSDFPIGSFFSGGLDSSLITSIASSLIKKPLPCFSIRFEDHDNINYTDSSIVISDDKPHTEELSKSINIDLIPITCNIDEQISKLEELAKINDRVPAWEQELSQYFLSKAAKGHVKSVLVGDAADETNFGYFFLLNDKVNYSPAGLMNLFNSKKRSKFLSKEIQDELKPLDLFEKEYTEIIEKAGYSFKGDKNEKIRAMSFLISKLWLGRLLHNGDIHTMNHSLEARVPFANLNILNIVSQISPEYGFKNGIEKSCLRDASSSYLPKSISQRKKSALPRDPRLGEKYQKILQKLIIEEKKFINKYLNMIEIKKICIIKNIDENDRMLMFNLISLIYWWKEYFR